VYRHPADGTRDLDLEMGQRPFDRAVSPTYHAPAMANPLLDRVLPIESADRSQVIEFKGKVGDFKRLSGIVEDDLGGLEPAQRPEKWRDGPVQTRLEFGWVDAGGELPAVEGRIDAGLTLVCQRCLEAFQMPVKTSFRMVFTAPDGDTGSLSGYDSWELEEDTVRPMDVVEEVLVMALPLAPVHGSIEDCGPLARRIADDEPDTVKPFADLRTQLDELKKQ
jgi:uncharacterized protein